MSLNPSTYDSIIQVGLPGSVPDNISNPEVITAYRVLSAAILNIVRAMEQFGGFTMKGVDQWSFLSGRDTILLSNQTRYYVFAGENLDYQDFVNLYDDAGVCKARLATSFDGAAPRRAHGFCNIPGGVVTGDRVEVLLQFGIMSISGIVAGTELYLSTTAGSPAATPDVAAGHLEQHLGVGIATDLAFITIAMGSFIQH